MKDLVKLNEDNWHWPIRDVTSWEGQKKQSEIFENIKPYVKNRRVMIQAGGNCGFILSKFVDKFEHIYTFEPDPVNFYCLNLNVTSKNVTKFQSCLGSDNKLVGIEDHPTDIGGVHVKGEGFTPCIQIDSLKLNGCDLIQLDVEGYEYDALLGATDTIQRFKPTLCLEWCEKWANRYNVQYSHLESLLESLNYKHVSNSGVDKIYTYKSQ